MGVVFADLEILILILVDRVGAAQNLEPGQRARVAAELEAGLVEMIGIEVAVAAGPDKGAGLQAALLGEHVREERVAGDVEGHAEEHVGAALVELEVQAAVGDLGLEQAVARGERHAVDLGRVPGADDLAAGGRVGVDLVDEARDLIDAAAVRPLPVAPLLAVDGAEIAILVRPFVPNADLVVLEIGDVGVALQEPQQFDDDRAQVQLLGGDEREAVGKVEAHLVAEDAQRADAGAVLLRHAFFQDAP